MRKPPLVERAEAEGLVWASELGEVAHVLAGERGRARVGTSIPASAAWIASALRPGVPLFVRGEATFDDPDVHRCRSLADEAPFDLLVTDDGDISGLLVPGGIALVVEAVPTAESLLAVALGNGAVLAVHIR